MQEVHDKIKECVWIAQSRYGKYFRIPTVSYDIRGAVAGKAFIYQNHIKLNPVLLRENKDHFINQTVPHEVAHLIAHQVYGNRIRPHGREWASIMSLFGRPANRCHSYEVTRSRTVKMHEVKCGCKTKMISSIRYNRMVKGLATYKCKRCHQLINLSSSSLVTQ